MIFLSFLISRDSRPRGRFAGTFAPRGHDISVISRFGAFVMGLGVSLWQSA